ncbi:hypothetical protein ACFFUZ_24775 [Kibdelosporangium philippinense]
MTAIDVQASVYQSSTTAADADDVSRAAAAYGVALTAVTTEIVAAAMLNVLSMRWPMDD